MAQTCTSITKGSATNATSAATASVTPIANRVYYLGVITRTGISADPTQPTASGAGLTWVVVLSVVYDNTSSSRKRLTVFRACGPSPSNGAITIDEAGQTQTDFAWILGTITETEAGGTNGSGAIVQSVSNFDGSAAAATITATLAAFASTAHGTLGFFGEGNGSTWTAGSGFTKIDEQASGASITIMMEFKASNDTTVDATDGANSELGVIAMEIRTERHVAPVTISQAVNRATTY